MKKTEAFNIRKHLTKRNIAIFLLIFSACSFFYKDSGSIIRQSVNYWKAFFGGYYFAYYKNGGGAWGIFLHTLLAIWHLPVYIAGCIFPDMDPREIFPIRIYSKMYSVILVAASGRYFRRICKSLGLSSEDGDTAHLLFMTGAFTVAAFAIAGQCDMPGIFLTLMALTFFLEEKELPFLVAFTLAGQCKFFPLFILLPLLFYRYKNIIACAVRAALPVVSYLLLQLPFMLSTGSSETSSGGRKIVMRNLFGNEIEIFGNTTYLIWILFLTVCIFAYIKKTGKGKAFAIDSLYFGSAGMLLALLPVYAEPYRFVYLGAILPPMLLLRRDALPRRLAVFTVFEASTIFGGMFLDRHVYDIQTMHGMLWDMILPMRKFEFPTLARTFEFMESHKLAPFFSVFVAVYAAFTIYFLYEYHPKHIAENKEDEEKLKPIHLYAGWAISFIVPCISMLYYIYGVVRNFILHFFPQLNLPV